MTSNGQYTKRVTASVGEVCRAAYRFVFPPCCPLCHGEQASGSLRIQGQFVTPVLCDDCAAEIVPPRENRCRRCGLSLGPFITSDDGCPSCVPRQFRFDRVIRLGTYDDFMRDACIRGKAPHMQPLSAALANLLWLTEQADFEAVGIDLVVPVPRHWTRRVLREHHQAETLSRVLAKRLKRPHVRTLLRKVRLTPDQSDLPAAQRKENLRKAFAVSFVGRRIIANKTVLLVDDILTTGTTANECARTLLQAGAKQVVVAVLAVVPAVRR